MDLPKNLIMALVTLLMAILSHSVRMEKLSRLKEIPMVKHVINEKCLLLKIHLHDKIKYGFRKTQLYHIGLFAFQFYQTVATFYEIPIREDQFLINNQCNFCRPRDVHFHRMVTCNVQYSMRKTTRLKSGRGFGQTNSPLSTARVLIDAVGLCLLRVIEVWRLFAPDLRRWINSFSGSDFKPRLVYKTWYFCYFFTNFDQQF